MLINELLIKIYRKMLQMIFSMNCNKNFILL